MQWCGAGHKKEVAGGQCGIMRNNNNTKTRRYRCMLYECRLIKNESHNKDMLLNVIIIMIEAPLLLC
jgi:hypothetical protein